MTMTPPGGPSWLVVGLIPSGSLLHGAHRVSFVKQSGTDWFLPTLTRLQTRGLGLASLPEGWAQRMSL